MVQKLFPLGQQRVQMQKSYPVRRLFITSSYCVCTLFSAASLETGFSSPNFVTPYGSGAYENVVVWYVGQTKEATYDISGTGLENYTVALWQQDIAGGGATAGPVVNSRF